MRRSFTHRIAALLAALSLLLSAAPTSLAATSAEEGALDCFLSDVSSASPVPPASGSGVPSTGIFVTAQTDRSDTDGPRHGPGPCCSPFTSCASAGTCSSVTPPHAGAAPTFSPGLVSAETLGPEAGLSSPASGVLTPPPRR